MKSSRLEKIWNKNPLTLIMLLAILFRAIAVIFAKGFGMHDDHFLVIEVAQSWVDGTDYNHWLPGSFGNIGPSGHSYFYVGIHYFILLFFKFLGISDPQVKMFLIRLLHAAFSLITVFYGYKITEKVSNLKTARIAGLLLALYFFIPWLSVRNLVEVVCIPFLILSVWVIIKAEAVPKSERISRKLLLNYFITGLLSGMAMDVRFQSFFFVAGLGLAILIKLKWKELLAMASGIMLSFVLLQGITDMFLWGYPFAEFGEYVHYNIANASNYGAGPWHKYLSLLLGIMIPPVSIFLFIGFFRTWKKYILIFLPTFIFLLFHSIFPNKQERFIIPVIPFIIILGMIGWNDLVEKSAFLQHKKKIIKGCWIFFWIINLTVLPVISTMYSKKSRIESMVYLSKYPDIGYILIEDTNNGSAKVPPLFYLNQWIYVYEDSKDHPMDTLRPTLIKNGPLLAPRFILFFDDLNLQQRVDSMKTEYPGIKYETMIEPGFIDKLLYQMNPLNNVNQTIYIYKNTALIK